jgi:hypothetical protein
MQILGLVWGILSVVGMLVGFVPCLGWLNWFLIPFAGVGVIISGVALSSNTEPNKGAAIGGLLCCAVALVFGLIRLFLGGGLV